MRVPESARQIEGSGSTLVLVHGSAADRTTWMVPSMLLKKELRLVSYDRRGAPAFPIADGEAFASLEEHAQDLAELIVELGVAPVTVCGSSFGAVVCLELLKTRPELVRGAILCEPPLPPSDEVPPVHVEFRAEFEKLVAEGRGLEAGEFFLRTVLTDQLFEQIPRRFQERSKALWPQIHADIHALKAYRVGYSSLASIERPVLLLGGQRSIPAFSETLDSLEHAIPTSSRIDLAGAGHMMHAEAARGFATAVLDFMGSLP